MHPNHRRILSGLVILNSLLSAPAALAARFVDLSSSWAQKYINLLSDQGIISAEKDGKFNPEQPVTRAVLAAWLVKVLAIENQPVSSTPSFADVKPSDWFYKPVEIIRQNNYISGYADGFRPHQYIQRAEVISIMARTLGLAQPDDAAVAEQLAKFKDGGKVPDWARVGLAEAAQCNILVNNPDPKTIGATQIATRADTAALLYRLGEYLNRQQISDATTKALSPDTSARTSTLQSPNQSYPSNQRQALPNTGYAPSPADDYPSSYQGEVQQGAPGAQPGIGQGQASAAPPPVQGGLAAGTYASPGRYPLPPPSGQVGGNNPPDGYLQGQVSVIAAGTHFQATLRNSIDSATSQPGEEIQATLNQPILSGSGEVVPASSRIIGHITNVVSAKRFRFGANGKVDIHFTELETPDGRRFPMAASIDTTQLRLTGGTTAGRVGKGLLTTGIGAGGGAALGTALGAIVGATGGGRVGKSTGMGAVFGTALGAGVGGVGAVVRKGSEVRIPAGTTLPIQLDQSMQITADGTPPGQQPYAGGYPQPVRRPAGDYFPQ